MVKNSQLTKIKVLVMDVDGVLTDGKIIFDSEGREVKVFDVQDGFGLVLLKKLGFKTAIITARGSKVVKIRARDLMIDKVYLNAFPKINFYGKLCSEFGVKDDEICYIGDDLADIQIMKKVGLPVAVANAVSEVKKKAAYVTRAQGGAGAIREVIELILKAQGKWGKVLASYR